MSTLNIKNPETCRLVHQLAELTGESMTAAVEQAVRERLERLAAERDQSSLEKFQRLTALVNELTANATDEDRSFDYDAWLYDEQGLPR